MGHYIYDGTFYGLMTVIARILSHGDTPDSIQPVRSAAPDLFAAPIRIETVEFVAEELAFQIRNEISNLTFDHVVYAFLSEYKNCEMLIYHYIRRGFAMGAQVDRLLTDRTIAKIHTLTRRVEREVNRFKGFVRFSALADGSYYATIEPDYFILPVLAPHFVKRLSDQSWIIHDLRRNKAAIYDQHELCVSDISADKQLVYAAGDEEHKRLWKQYYDSIGIQERANPALQQQLLPLKYQGHLPEMG